MQQRRRADRPDRWVRALTAPEDRPDGTQSIRRAFLILRILATAGTSGLALTEIARAAGLARPTAHRFLNALAAEGMIEQPPRTRRYALATQLDLAPRAANSPLLAAAATVLSEAAEEIGDTLFLTVRAGLETVCVARRLGSYPIQVLALETGASRPLGVSSAGIAMLATLRPAASRRLIMQNERHLPSYGMSVADSLAAVAQARADGYALRERGLVAGTRAASVAFARHDAQAWAALTVAGISRRMQPQRLAIIIGQLKIYADRIEQSLHTGSQ